MSGHTPWRELKHKRGNEMGFEKYGDVEKLDVLRGREAQILDEHSKRLGKTRVSDFTEKQKEALLEDLNEYRKENAEEVEEVYGDDGDLVVPESHKELSEKLVEEGDLERYEDEGGAPAKKK
jgi:hypothetical protein